MPNPPKSVALLKKLVSAARSIVTYQMGLPVGCIRVRNILVRLRPHIELSYPVFDGYLESVRDLPISSERLKWNYDALRDADKKLEAASSRFRGEIFEACYAIIDSHGSGSDQDAKA